MTLAIVAFLGIHGLLHLAIWLPHPVSDPATPPPFHPDRSAVLTSAHMRAAMTHQLSMALAVGSAAAYLLTGVGVAIGTAWVLPMAVAAAASGLLLKGLFFHPWLSLGIALDVIVVLAAATGWPVSLS